MKILIPVLFAFFAGPTFATVDGYDRAYIVIQDFNSEEFKVERVPIVGCYGLPQGARLMQFTSKYLATQNIGCGGEPVYENINVLTCAKVTDSKESEDYYGFSEVTLDISKCEAKDNAQFITMVRTEAKYNFPQQNKNKEVKLNLVK